MIAQDYTTLTSNGNLRVDWFPANGFVNYEAPTVAELNAGLNLSKAIAWSDFGFGMNASNTTDDPSIADTGHSKSRGSAQYGGAMSFYHPGTGTLDTDTFKLAQAAVGIPRTTGYIATRLDGIKKSLDPYVVGDLVSIYLVETDGQTNVITGEDSFRYTVKLVSQGTFARYIVARTGTLTVAPSAATLAVTAGQASRVKATVGGREYTQGVKWTSSDNTKAQVSSAGVVKGIAAGTATITATYAPTGATGTVTVTVS
jgi:hypothetical protein